jgi:hypothetical protein
MCFTRNWKEASTTRTVSTKSVYFENEHIAGNSLSFLLEVRPEKTTDPSMLGGKTSFLQVFPKKQVKQRIPRAVFGNIFDGDYHAIDS